MVYTVSTGTKVLGSVGSVMTPTITYDWYVVDVERIQKESCKPDRGNTVESVSGKMAIWSL